MAIPGINNGLPPHMPGLPPTEITVSCYDWVTEKGTQYNPSYIRGWGFNEKGENVTIRFPYKVVCYIELPTIHAGRYFHEWGDYHRNIIKAINDKIRPHHIDEFTFEMRKGIYYHSTDLKPYIKIRLNNHEALRAISKVCDTALIVRIPEESPVSIRFHEGDIDHKRRFLSEAGLKHTFIVKSRELVAQKINQIYKERYDTIREIIYDGSGIPQIDINDPIFKELMESKDYQVQLQEESRKWSTANCGLKYCQWFRVIATPVMNGQKLTRLQNEYTINAAQSAEIKPLPDTISNQWSRDIKPRILSYDIEQYSFNHKRFPRSFESTDAVFIITVVVQVLGEKTARKRYSVVYAPELINYEHMIKFERECKLVLCVTEADMERHFEEIIRTEDPDAIIGYNIYSYDNRVISERKESENRNWGNVGRTIYGVTETIQKNWKSSAYGFIDVTLVNMEGRLSYDLLPIIKRDFKLPKYDLDTVSRKFLGRGKHDVKAKRMFEIRENLTAARTLLDYAAPPLGSPVLNAQLTSAVCEAILRALSEIMKSGANIGPYTTTLLPEQRRLIFEYSVHEYTKLLNYAVEDSELTLDLFEKLSVWYSSRESASVNGISITNLFTRGQQIRGYSLVYDLASREGYVLSKEKFDKIPYKGAIVQHPVPGLYRNIICLDFASLYPTIIMAHNLCWTTYIKKEDWNKFPERYCHIFDWSEEVEEEVDEDDITEISGFIKIKKKKRVITVTHSHRFLRKEWLDEQGQGQTRVWNELTNDWLILREGILPRAIGSLVNQRRYVNKVLLPKEKDPMLKDILDKRQFALKLTANSMYGFTAAQEGGLLPLVYIAAVVTYIGRQSITRVNERVMAGIPDKDGIIRKGKVVYGDTDSTMVDFNIKDPAEAVTFGEYLAKYITNELFADMKPMTIEFEKAMITMLCIAPKKYCSIYIDSEGNPKIFTGGFLGNNIELHDNDGNIYSKYTEAYNEMKNGKILYDHCNKEVDFKTAIDPFDSKNSNILVKYLPRFVKFYKSSGEPIWFADNPKSIYKEIYFYPKKINDMGQEVTKMFYAIDPGTIYTKGVILARRDGCPAQLRAYLELMVHVMVKGLRTDKDWKQQMDDKVNWVRQYPDGTLQTNNTYYEWYRKQIFESLTYYKEGCNIIERHVNNLLHRQVDLKDLFFIKQMGGNYKSESYFMRIFSDELKREGKPISSGERIEYVISRQTDPQRQKLGYRVKTPEQYAESSESNEPYQIDYNYYLENVLMNCLEQMIQVGFQEEIALQNEFYRWLGHSERYKGKKVKMFTNIKYRPDGTYYRTLEKIINHSVRRDHQPIKSLVKILQYRENVIKSIEANAGRLPSQERALINEARRDADMKKSIAVKHKQWTAYLSTKAGPSGADNFQKSFEQYTTNNPQWSDDIRLRTGK